MNKETELDMNDLINSFDECSTDYTKPACVYYGDYLRDYQKEKLQLQNNWNELKEWLKQIQINAVYIDEWTIIVVRNKVEEIESRNNNE